MLKQATTPTVLIVEDSPDDCLIAMRAWEETHLGFDVRLVHDGKELLDYLYRRRKYHGIPNLPWPWLILLDLNMPRKDGRKALVELRAHPEWRHIPTVVFSGSTQPQDIQTAETLGAYDFITKPQTFHEYQRIIKDLGQMVCRQRGAA
ncbi:MAG: response regulator [Nitrospirota bacterium]|nr:response regulator [Nitrospirota bacterium]